MGEIVVLCISGLIVIGLILVGRHLYIKHKNKTTLKETEKALGAENENTDVEMPKVTEMKPVVSHSTVQISEGTNETYKVGQGIILKDGRKGELKYIGPTATSGDVIMYGIELD